ncbi:unnamed protein product [Ectocarpus sp. 12 AP-2014]
MPRNGDGSERQQQLKKDAEEEHQTEVGRVLYARTVESAKPSCTMTLPREKAFNDQVPRTDLPGPLILGKETLKKRSRPASDGWRKRRFAQLPRPLKNWRRQVIPKGNGGEKMESRVYLPLLQLRLVLQTITGRCKPAPRIYWTQIS